MIGITFRGTHRFFGGGAHAPNHEVPALLPVALAGRKYQVDLAEYRRRTLPLLRPATDTSERVGDQSLSNEGLWRVSATDWGSGAGQATFDGDDTDPSRFWTSTGVDVWTDGELTLLPRTIHHTAMAEDNLRVFYVNGYLCIVGGTGLQYLPPGGVWTAVTLTGVGTITSVADDGLNIYVADGTGIWRVEAGTAGPHAAWSTYDATFVAVVHGRLVAANASELSEISATGVATTVTTLGFPAGSRWTHAVSGAGGIILAATAGSRSTLYHMGIDDTGALAVPTVAAVTQPGEEVLALEANADLIFVGTNLGIRSGILANTRISLGLLVRTGPCRGFSLWGEYAWFTGDDIDGRPGLWRMHLGRFTDSDGLVFAYASDLRTPTDTTGVCTSVALIDGDPWFTVAASGLYAAHPTEKVPDGTISSGWVTFDTTIAKLPISVDVRHAPFAGALTATLEQDHRTDVLGITTKARTNDTRFTSGRVPFERARLVLHLQRATDPTTGPTIHRWTVNALPSGVRIDEIILPIVMGDQVASGSSGQIVEFQPLTEFRMLKRMEQAGTVLYQEGNTALEVRVDAVEVKPSRWDEQYQFFVSTIYVRLLTLET